MSGQIGAVVSSYYGCFVVAFARHFVPHPFNSTRQEVGREKKALPMAVGFCVDLCLLRFSDPRRNRRGS
jgi:hypothetical protein